MPPQVKLIHDHHEVLTLAFTIEDQWGQTAGSVAENDLDGAASNVASPGRVVSGNWTGSPSTTARATRSSSVARPTIIWRPSLRVSEHSDQTMSLGPLPPRPHDPASRLTDAPASSATALSIARAASESSAAMLTTQTELSCSSHGVRLGPVVEPLAPGLEQATSAIIGIAAPNSCLGRWPSMTAPYGQVLDEPICSVTTVTNRAPSRQARTLRGAQESATSSRCSGAVVDRDLETRVMGRFP